MPTPTPHQRLRLATSDRMTDVPQERLRAAIYDRASKDRSARGKSVGEQRAENEAECAENGWDVVERYVDNNLSASRFARNRRPSWELFLADLETRDFNVVVLWESSRGDRKASQWIAFLDLCRSKKVLIHVTTHRRTYDMGVARDWRTLAEDGVDNAYESEKLSERIKRGLRANAAEGRPHGRKLYGYVRRYDERTGKLLGQVIDERPMPAFGAVCVEAHSFIPLTIYTRAGVIREAADRYSSGSSMKSIMADLNRRGIRAPYGYIWNGSKLTSLLRNPGYIGYAFRGGQLTLSPDWFPPLLSFDVHYACVGRMADPERKGKRDSRAKHLLSGLAKCGTCGAGMRMQPDYPSKRGRYQCSPTDMRRSNGAKHVARGQDRTDDYVTGVAIAWMSQPETAAVVAEGGEQSGGEQQRVLDEIAELRQKLEDVYAEFAAPGATLTATGLAMVEQRILKQIDTLEARARALRGARVLAPARLGSREAAEAQWKAWDLEQQREFLRALFVKIEILPLGAGCKTYTDEQSVRFTWRDNGNADAAGEGMDQEPVEA